MLFFYWLTILKLWGGLTGLPFSLFVCLEPGRLLYLDPPAALLIEGMAPYDSTVASPVPPF